MIICAERAGRILQNPFNDAVHPDACLLGERGVKKSALAMDAALVLGGDERFFGRWEFGIAEGNDDALTW